MGWMRCRLSFVTLRSAIMCVRGSRSSRSLVPRPIARGEEGSGRVAIYELSPRQDPGVTNQIRWSIMTYSCGFSLTVIDLWQRDGYYLKGSYIGHCAKSCYFTWLSPAEERAGSGYSLLRERQCWLCFPADWLRQIAMLCTAASSVWHVEGSG